ncbi:MAG: hypothetical protein F4Y26_18750 [Gammaproteobacteria bacterium]|nr:hypothetical protein [Gammaproteobacteria bacterium]
MPSKSASPGEGRARLPGIPAQKVGSGRLPATRQPRARAPQGGLGQRRRGTGARPETMRRRPPGHRYPAAARPRRRNSPSHL